MSLVSTFAFAQETPTTALDWLNKARSAHGGSSLENLIGYKETGIFRIHASGSQAQRDGTYTISADLSGNRYRLEYVVDNVRSIQQYSNNSGFIWSSSQSRKESAPASALPTLKAPLYQGWLGLRFKTRETASLIGTQTFGTQSGIAVAATTVSISTQYLFSSTGELIAERVQNSIQGTIIFEYRNSQIRSGIKIPLETRLLNGTTLIATHLAQTTTLNPTWSTTDFASP
jgi:hypothetical protein